MDVAHTADQLAAMLTEKAMVTPEQNAAEIKEEKEKASRTAARGDEAERGSLVHGSSRAADDTDPSLGGGEGRQPKSTQSDDTEEDTEEDTSEESQETDPLDDPFGDDEESSAADDDDADDTERDADTDEDDDNDTPKLRDTDKVSVTVDGEDVQVTLGELKRRYAGEGAIEKRLQAATEARTKAVEDYQRGRQLTEQVFQQFGNMMFRRTVPEPDLETLNSNPPAYMRQKALYDAETQAITQAQSQIYELTQALDEAQEKARLEHRQQAAAKLRQIMPVFNDPVRGPKVKDALIEAAKEIGYTEAEIAACTDPLMFKTMALAARELRRSKGTSVEKSKEKTRTLAKVSKKSAPPDSNLRREREAMQRAKKTGSIDDVAAAMVVTPRRKTRNIA